MRSSPSSLSTKKRFSNHPDFPIELPLHIPIERYYSTSLDSKRWKKLWHLLDAFDVEEGRFGIVVELRGFVASLLQVEQTVRIGSSQESCFLSCFHNWLEQHSSDLIGVLDEVPQSFSEFRRVLLLALERQHQLLHDGNRIDYSEARKPGSITKTQLKRVTSQARDTIQHSDSAEVSLVHLRTLYNAVCNSKFASHARKFFRLLQKFILTFGREALYSNTPDAFSSDDILFVAMIIALDENAPTAAVAKYGELIRSLAYLKGIDKGLVSSAHRKSLDLLASRLAGRLVTLESESSDDVPLRQLAYAADGLTLMHIEHDTIQKILSSIKLKGHTDPSRSDTLVTLCLHLAAVHSSSEQLLDWQRVFGAQNKVVGDAKYHINSSEERLEKYLEMYLKHKRVHRRVFVNTSEYFWGYEFDMILSIVSQENTARTVAVEFDGPHHSLRKMKDHMKDRVAARYGIPVIRIFPEQLTALQVMHKKRQRRDFTEAMGSYFWSAISAALEKSEEAYAAHCVELRRRLLSSYC